MAILSTATNIFTSNLTESTYTTHAIEVGDLNESTYGDYPDYYHFDRFITEKMRNIVTKIRAINTKTFDEGGSRWDPVRSNLKQMGIMMYGELG